MEDKLILEEGKEKFTLEFKKDIDNIKQIIQWTIIEFHNFEFPKYIWNYKKYLWFVADRLWTIDAWQSNVDYPLVSAVVDTMFGNIFDFWYEFWINESKLKRLCTEAFDFRWTGKSTFKEVTKEILICWKWYVKDFLLKEDNTDTYFWKELKQTIKTPSMYYISIFDVMYDRTKWLSKSPYKIIRTFSTWDSIKAKILPLILEGYKEEKHELVKKDFDRLLELYKEEIWSRFSAFDYNPVKTLTSTTQFMNAESKFNYDLPLCTDKLAILWWISWEWTTINDESKDNYFLNINKSTFEITEYTTNDRKVIFINGNLIFSWKKNPNIWEIREANFSLIPWTWSANWVADNLWWLQDINNMLWNAFLDNIKLVLWPMFKVSGNMPIWKNWTIDFKKFKAFRTNGSTSIEKVQLWVTDFAPINFMQIVQSFAEQRSWVSNYIMWWQGSIERVSWGIDMKFNQYKSKLTPITDSIDQMMWNIARSWILMYFKFYSKEELLKMWVTVTDKFVPNNEWVEKFDTFLINNVDIKTILDERNVTFTYNSLNKLTKENSRASVKEVLPAMLQYAASSLNMPEVVKLLAGQDFDPEKIIFTKEEQSENNKNFDAYKWQWWSWSGYDWWEQWWWYQNNYVNNYEWAQSDKFKSQYDTKDKWIEKYSSQQPTYQDYTDEQLIEEAQNIS